MVVGKLSDNDKIEKGMTFIIIVGLIGFMVLALTAYLHEETNREIENWSSSANNDNLGEGQKAMLAEFENFDLTGKIFLNMLTDWFRYGALIVVLAAFIMFRTGRK
jgi:hypothetical protein